MLKTEEMNPIMNFFLCLFYVIILIMYFYDDDDEKSLFYGLLNICYFIEAFY